MIATPIKHSPYQRAVGVFENCQTAEAALQELRNAGFDMNRVFVIALDTPIENGLGIPEERTKVAQERILRGYYLVRVYGTPNEIARAETILQNWRSEEWGV